MNTVVDALRDALVAFPELELVVLFGSATGEKMTPSSDVDIGLTPYLADATHRHRVEATLERAVGRALDVVYLDSAPPLLRFEVARGGVLLRGDAERWTEFRAHAMIDWWDWAATEALITRAAIARMTGDASHGAT